MGSKCGTNISAVYLKMNEQPTGRWVFKSREIKMINPRDGNREDPRRHIKRIAFIQSSEFESDYAPIRTSVIVSLDVEMDGVGLHVYLADQFFGNWSRKKM